MTDKFFQDLFKNNNEVMILKLNGINNIYNVQRVAEMVDRHELADEGLKKSFKQLKTTNGNYFETFKYMVDLYIQTEEFKRRNV